MTEVLAGTRDLLTDERIELLESWKAGHTGFSAHNAVTVRADDGGGLERLAGYLLRPPLSLERLILEPGLVQRIRTYRGRQLVGSDRGRCQPSDRSARSGHGEGGQGWGV